MRKSTMLSLFAALLLIAGAAVAQLPQHDTSRGTVLSYTPGDQLVISTDDGQETFKIVAGTTLPSDEEIQVGDAIIVDWNVAESADAMPEVRTIRLDDQATDRMATRERESESMETSETAETTTRDTSTQSATEQRRTERSSTTDRDTMDTTSQQQATSQRSTQTRSSLPQTGSNLPLIGLIGLLTLTGAATLTLRR